MSLAESLAVDILYANTYSPRGVIKALTLLVSADVMRICTSLV